MTCFGVYAPPGELQPPSLEDIRRAASPMLVRTYSSTRHVAAMAEVRRLVAGEETSEPVLGSHCHQCEWFGKCKRWVDETRDPTGLFFVGSQKFGLKAAGLAYEL